MGCRRLLVAVLAIAVGAGIVASVAAQRRPAVRDAPTSESEVRGTTALALARQACTSVALAVIDIGRNASSDRVLSRLQRAQRDGYAAAKRDSQWTQLDSGVQALLTSVRRDDPQLADVGLRVVRDVCAGLGVPV